MNIKKFSHVLATIGVSFIALNLSSPAHAKASCGENYLWSPNLHLEYPNLTKKQQKQVWRNTEDYVDLKADAMSDDLREAVLEAREKVEKNLGWLPRIRTNGQLPYMPFLGLQVKLYKRGAKIRRGSDNEIATYVFSIPQEDHELLNSNNVWVDARYRNMGLSELMLAEILAGHPWIKRIRVNVDLRETNDKLFLKSYKKKGCEKAIRDTYAQKKFDRLGFSQMIESDCEDPMGITFTVARPKK